MKKSPLFKRFSAKLALLTTFLTSVVSSSYAAEPPAPTAISKIINGVGFYQSLAKIEKMITPHCAQLDVIEPKQVQLPVAKNSEVHLICSGYGPENLAEVAFVFADDNLTMVEVSGGISKALDGVMTEKPMQFMSYMVDFPQLIVQAPKTDSAWFMTKEAVHPHLFLTPNPYLVANKSQVIRHGNHVNHPDILQFGQTIETLQPLIEKQCQLSYVEQIDKVWLANKPKQQTQINCYGYDYAGYNRKIEAVFGDGILQQAWILTGAGEEQRIRKMLIAKYGEPQLVTDEYEVFNDWQVALRKDKPEVLMVSKTIGRLLAKRFVAQ